MKKDLKIYILMLLCTVFWAGAFIAGKLGVHDLSPVMLTFLRMFFATILIFPYMMYKEKEQWKLNKQQFRAIVLTGLVGMIGYHVFFFEALKYTSATNASMINAMNPLVTALLSAFILKEHINRKQLLLIFTALFAVVMTLVNWDFNLLIKFTLTRGDYLMFIGMSCWASYSIIVKKVMPYFSSPLKLATYSFLSASVIISPFAIYEMTQHNVFSVGLNPFIAVLYMALFPTVLGYSIQQVAIKEIGPSRSALFINLVPIVSMLMAFIILGEKFNPLNLISVILIIFSVVSYQRLASQSNSKASVHVHE